MSNSIPSFTPVSLNVFAEYASRIDHDLLASPATQNALTMIANLIGKSPLKEETIKACDLACNKGYLISFLLEFDIERYIGMDFIPELLEEARIKAPDRFPGIPYEFIHGDIINPDSYKGLPRDNNLITILAVAGHLTVNQIKATLENASGIMSNNNLSRIVMNFGYYNFVENGLKEENEDGMRVVKYNLEGYEFRAFNPHDLERVLTALDTLEIDMKSSYFGENTILAKHFYPVQEAVIFFKKKKF